MDHKEATKVAFPYRPVSSEPLLSDLKIRYEFLGLQALLMPYIQYVSAQRAMMFASNVAQAVVVDGCEPAMVCTGYEGIIGQYEFDETRRDQDIVILAVIPKFQNMCWNSDNPTNPTVTVIYMGQEDKRIGYFDVSTYHALHDGFGYMNKMLNQFQLKTNNCIPKNMKIVTSPNHKSEHLYCLGTNACIAYISDWTTTEDAFEISDEFAEKNTHTAISTLRTVIRENEIPRNLYGSTDEFLAFPGVGSQVREDGVLLALCNKDETTFITDLTQEALMTAEKLHDQCFYADEPGATILDVNVYINHDIYRKLKGKPGPYEQFVKYKEQHDLYYQAILAVYDKVQEDGMELRPEFNTLVTRCIGLLAPRNRVRQKLQLVDKKEPVEFISVEIVYGWKRKVGLGFKFTGYDGSKGVVSKITPKKYMPRTADGIHTDFKETNPSVINRMNPSQFYVQFQTGLSRCVQMTVRGMTSIADAFEYIMGYLEDVRPALRQQWESGIRQRGEVAEFVDSVKQDGIMLPIGFINNITLEWVLYMAKKYGLKQSTLKYIVEHEDGSLEEIETISKTIVGDKPMMLLGKIPAAMLHCVEISYGNQFRTPHKPTSKTIKAQSPIGQTCQRLGEDEICMLSMSVGPDTVIRMMSLNGNSPKAAEMYTMAKLTEPTPSNITHIPMTTTEMIKTNAHISLFAHLMAPGGYDVRSNRKDEDK